MNKREFLSELREVLSYDLPEQLVDNNLRYYSGYIDDEVRKGRRHEEVLAELGDPKLIAKSIVDAIKSGADGVPGTADDVSFSDPAYEDSRFQKSRRQETCDTFDESGNAACDDSESGAAGGAFGDGSGANGNGLFGRGNGQNGSWENGNRTGGGNGGFHHVQYQSGCFGCLMVFLAVWAVLALVGMLIGGVLTFLSPVLAPVLVIMLIVWLVHRIKENR